jgi:hypothetical protein
VTTPETPDPPEPPETPASGEPDASPSPDEAGWAAPSPPPVPSAAWAPPPAAPSAPSAAWVAPGTIGGAPAARQSVNSMAVASLVLGLCCWCFFVPGILAVIFGHLALGKIATSEGREKGRGMAIAGIVLGWVSIAVLAGITIAWLVYGLSNL